MISDIVRKIKQLFLSKNETNEWFTDVTIEGMQHYRGSDLAEMIKIGDELSLKNQPENKFDKNAIIVLWRQNKIGYLPKEIAQQIQDKIINQGNLIAKIIEINPANLERKWIKIKIQAK